MTKGSLTVIGTGIRTVGQLTTEAIAWIKSAEKLLYVIADPVAETMMKELNPDGATSIACYYEEGKDRNETYEQMVQHIVQSVKDGYRTVGAFYGHPGVFAYPSHESIRRLKSEGYDAKMLPGISAEDCLFADLGVDPAVNGCQSYEATDFLLNGRQIDNSSQLILWQVGSLCNWTYEGNNYNLKTLPLLIMRLQEYFPPTHNVVIYEAAIFPNCPPIIHNIPLYTLSEQHVSPASTLYIPPCRPTTPDHRYGALLQQVMAS